MLSEKLSIDLDSSSLRRELGSLRSGGLLGAANAPRLAEPSVDAEVIPSSEGTKPPDNT